MKACECSDHGCPVHKGAGCNRDSYVTLFRSDMEDHTGTNMCEECAQDALDSGVFYVADGPYDESGYPLPIPRGYGEIDAIDPAFADLMRERAEGV